MELTEQQLIAKRKTDIKIRLQEIDLLSIRAIRANDTEFIEKYEFEAQQLRNELKELT